MAEVVVFHHAQGLTPGVTTFADELRHAGHTVHTPDLFDGRTFSTIEDGMAYAEKIGFPGEIFKRGSQARRGPQRRAGLRRVLARRASRSDAGADAVRSARRAALLFVYPRVGIRFRLA